MHAAEYRAMVVHSTDNKTSATLTENNTVMLCDDPRLKRYPDGQLVRLSITPADQRGLSRIHIKKL